MKTIGKLTQKQVDAILRAPFDGKGSRADGAGLALVVSQGKDGQVRASYVLRARALSGTPLRIGLGSASAVTLAQARELAEEKRQSVRKGEN
ncbi:MAG TPA: Arm DNA-binding domain-containing protein, partial [Myxococcales bacterium]|nr:Arm DNA-binding domain-containing protein [Myxococcales bacterium]